MSKLKCQTLIIDWCDLTGQLMNEINSTSIFVCIKRVHDVISPVKKR